jgi:cytidylate kinase
MKTRVICISRSLGAGGQYIARAVSQKLSFRLVDEEIIQRAAEREGVDVAVVADAERRRSFLERLFDSFAIASLPEMTTVAPGFFVAPGAHETCGGLFGTEQCRQLIRDVVRETADQGDVVILAHAAAIALGGRDDILRVLVTASPATRAARLAAIYALDARRADAELKNSDAARRAYLHDFYGVTTELPTHYDLVINTDILAPVDAADVVVAAARK